LIPLVGLAERNGLLGEGGGTVQAAAANSQLADVAGRGAADEALKPATIEEAVSHAAPAAFRELVPLSCITLRDLKTRISLL